MNCKLGSQVRSSREQSIRSGHSLDKVHHDTDQRAAGVVSQEVALPTRGCLILTAMPIDVIGGGFRRTHSPSALGALMAEQIISVGVRMNNRPPKITFMF
ncbi:MAG: hypothetical protein H8E24_11260 [Verrucomicrobia bacterium]|nr:hypothetical protein [Verrucomicrobiota bacterium]